MKLWVQIAICRFNFLFTNTSIRLRDNLDNVLTNAFFNFKVDQLIIAKNKKKPNPRVEHNSLFGDNKDLQFSKKDRWKKN